MPFTTLGEKDSVILGKESIGGSGIGGSVTGVDILWLA